MKQQEQDYPRLTEDDLPGVRRDWKAVVERVRELAGEWALVEEGVDKSRASSVRRSLGGYYPDMQVSQRKRRNSDVWDVYARQVTE